MGTKIRLLTPADLSQMIAIEKQAMNTPWPASVMRDNFSAAHHKSYGIENEKKELLAFGIIAVVFDEAELLSMAVRSDAQRQGYGFKLLQFLIKQAKKAKAKTFSLEVRQSNTIAINLYRKLDFKVDGIRKGYYPSVDDREREDAVRLILVLS